MDRTPGHQEGSSLNVPSRFLSILHAAAAGPLVAPPEPPLGGGPAAPWHFLYFLPLPHGQGSLRPILSRRITCCGFSFPPPPPTIRISCASRRFRRWYWRIISS